LDLGLFVERLYVFVDVHDKQQEDAKDYQRGGDDRAGRQEHEFIPEKVRKTLPKN
jgi:hypothetical protein